MTLLKLWKRNAAYYCNIHRAEEKKEGLFQDRVASKKKKKYEEMQQETATIPKLISDILLLEEKYMKFFSERNLEWDQPAAKRTAWVN